MHKKNVPFFLAFPTKIQRFTVFAFTFVTCCCFSVAQSCPTLCDPIDCSTPGFPVLHHLLELGQTHVHRVGDAIQPSHPESLIWRLPRMSSDSRRVCSTGCWVGCWLGRGALPEWNNLQAENLAGNRGKVECLLSKWPDPHQASIVDFVQLNIKRKRKFPRKCQSSKEYA